MSEAAAKYIREAARLVSGDRAKQHGDMEKVHARAAKLWSAYLDIEEAPLSPADVAMLMILLKMARDGAGDFNADNFIDMCGYAGIAGALRGGG